jgi:hypothetical protein
MANLLAHEWRIGLKDHKEAQKGIAKRHKKDEENFLCLLRSLLCLFAIPFCDYCTGARTGRPGWTLD